MKFHIWELNGRKLYHHNNVYRCRYKPILDWLNDNCGQDDYRFLVTLSNGFNESVYDIKDIETIENKEDFKLNSSFWLRFLEIKSEEDSNFIRLAFAGVYKFEEIEDDRKI